jgi:hypothetical protein
MSSSFFKIYSNTFGNVVQITYLYNVKLKLLHNELLHNEINKRNFFD